MTRRQKRQRRPGRGGGRKADARAVQADSTLKTMLVNYLALPNGHTFEKGGQVYMSAEALLYIRAMRERCAQLGGEQAMAAVCAELCPGAPPMPIGRRQ